MGVLLWFIGFVWWLLFGAFVGWVAGQKGRNELGWFLLSLVFGFLALFALCIVPPLPRSENEPSA